ncbi:hypothetical protein BS50DRAFT_567603 [Corynespora cassiicola Philippines]|uniref:Uncharacterized protein n=1 Tax=Corynespora cassiicola Philippines TaxID=1448308 RepID=A0A2T2PBS9_CORCC|nr:hypothetical protein BS50DRAFT_567603 [Corynespora cassiicola Philippines]
MSQKTALQRLIDEPKGKTSYYPDQGFLLHVFWEAPNKAAAERVLAALNRCARATHRDTPCVPTYYFRISTLESDLVSNAPKTLGKHPQLAAAWKKLEVGVPKPAVVADMIRRGLDPGLLDLNPEDALPSSMEEDATPVMLECTEIYLDQRCFYEHAGSREYLDAYGEVMTPGLQNSHVTVRLGTPTAEIIEKVLVPMLRERAEPMPTGCQLWRWPEEIRTPSVQELGTSVNEDHVGGAGGVLFAMNFQATGSIGDTISKLPDQLKRLSSTCIGFAHPLRTNTTRVLCVLPELISHGNIWKELCELPLIGIEIHCHDALYGSIREGVEQAGFACPCTVKEIQTGYLVHERSYSLQVENA